MSAAEILDKLTNTVEFETRIVLADKNGDTITNFFIDEFADDDLEALERGLRNHPVNLFADETIDIISNTFSALWNNERTRGLAVEYAAIHGITTRVDNASIWLY